MKSQNRFYKAKPLWIYERFQEEKKKRLSATNPLPEVRKYKKSGGDQNQH